MNIRKAIIFLSFFIFFVILFDGLNIFFPFLGEWHGNFANGSDPKNYQKEVTLTFFPFDILLIDFTGNENEYYNVYFSYKSLDENNIVIKGRFYDVLSISYGENQINIQSENGFIHNGVYYRRAMFIEKGVFLFIVIFIVFLLWNRSRRKNAVPF